MAELGVDVVLGEKVFGLAKLLKLLDGDGVVWLVAADEVGHEADDAGSLADCAEQMGKLVEGEAFAVKTGVDKEVERGFGLGFLKDVVLVEAPK